MGYLPPWRALLLGVVGLLMLAVGRCGSSSSHFLRYFYTVVSEPSQGLPRFSILGYVDDQPFNKYDGIMRRDVPIAPWMEEFGKEDPQYWERNTQDAQITESVLRVHLETLQNRYNQTSAAGFHTLQWMYGCEMGMDGLSRGGNYQYAYDGEDFIALDMKTFTWTTSDPLALETTRRWENQQWAQRTKVYLEDTCVKSLQGYLVYGKETLQRTETPTVEVARKAGGDGQETLVCRVHGFYPKEIEVTWMKDGEDQKPETLTGGVVPNSDGTYHTWLSIEVDSKERKSYRCLVGHDSLLKLLDVAWEDPVSNWRLVLGILGGVALVILVGIFVFLRYQGGPLPAVTTLVQVCLGGLRTPTYSDFRLNKTPSVPDQRDMRTQTV